MKNKIKSVTLLGNGTKGIKVNVITYRVSNKLATPIEDTKKMKVAVPSNITASMRKLRYYLLESTERIQKGWKEHKIFRNGTIDDELQLKGDAMKEAYRDASDLFGRTFIDAVEIVDDEGVAYRIIGRIENKDGYISNTVSPLITSEHSTLFYREVVDIVGQLCEDVLSFLYGEVNVIEQTVQQMIEEDSSLGELSEDEQVQKAMQLLEKRGCIVIVEDEDTARMIAEGSNDITEADDDTFGKVDVAETIHDHTAGEETFSDFEEVEGETEVGDGDGATEEFEGDEE